MPFEKSAGAIIFRKEKGKNLFLLLKYPALSHRSKKDYWDFPKGHIEKGETEIEAVKREVKEETGIRDLKFIKGFKESIKYFFKYKGENIFKVVVFYLAETNTKDVRISFEHSGYKWLLYEEALEALSFQNAKEILKKANDFLSRKSLQSSKKDS